jgi:hypothetical protein
LTLFRRAHKERIVIDVFRQVLDRNKIVFNTRLLSFVSPDFLRRAKIVTGGFNDATPPRGANLTILFLILLPVKLFLVIKKQVKSPFALLDRTVLLLLDLFELVKWRYFSVIHVNSSRVGS